MNVLQPLFLDDSFFLLPQHLQFQDKNCQLLLRPLYKYGYPHLWGVGGLLLDEEALQSGLVKLKEGSFLFPDGSYAVLHQNALMEDRSFQEVWKEAGHTLAVYIGLRRWSADGDNVAVCAGPDTIGGAATHFVTDVASEPSDPEAQGPYGQVRRQKYLLRLFWDNEVAKLGDYHLIPILQLQRSGTAVQQIESFIPPVLSLKASRNLLSMICDLRDALVARSRGLEWYQKRTANAKAAVEMRELSLDLVLSSLNRYLPILARAAEVGQVHPLTIYLGLLQLVGELSTFAESASIAGAGRLAALKEYNHLDLGGCFTWARDLILELLDEVTAGPDYVIPLNQEGMFYSADLRPAVFRGNNRYFLAVRSQTDRRTMALSLETAAKVSTRQHLPVLTAKALPGVELTYLPVPPPELPQNAQTLYLALDHYSEEWTRVVRERNVALHWDSAPADLHLELMVLSRLRGTSFGSI